MELRRFIAPLIELIYMEQEDILMDSDFLVEGDYDYDDAEWRE